MKKVYAVFTGIILITLVVLAGKFFIKQPVGPIISITPVKNDLGAVIYGDVATYTIKVANIGDADLVIRKISTSCGCTKAKIEEADKVIAPGKSTNVAVSFDPAVHKDDTDVGEIVRIIYINSNDAKNPEVQSELNAFVIKSSTSTN